MDSILILTDDTVVCKVFALETQANNWGEPERAHIDRDNVPRHGECLYVSMWPRVAFVASMFPRTRVFT